MKIYLLEQNVNNDYDTYDSCVVCAETEEDAKTIHPDGDMFIENNSPFSEWAFNYSNIICTELGEANANQERGVILASFNAS